MQATFVSRTLAGLVLAGAATVAGAQGPPGTDIHLVPLSSREGRISVGAPVNITARPGYDNQPSFTPDGRSILFTSIRSDGQADIYRYDIAARGVQRVTSTPESEYSATVMPGGTRMSVIRVEADSTQRLWSFDLGGGDPRVVLEAIKPVGYHAWANSTTLALFVLGSPATLEVADVRTGQARQIVGGIGRSLNRIPNGGMISFVHKGSADDWWIRQLDVRSDSMTSLVRTLPGSEDHAWLPDGSLLMARADSLFRWSPNSVHGPSGASRRARTDAWELVATFSNPALRRISRLAVSPRGDYVALVSAEAPPD